MAVSACQPLLVDCHLLPLNIFYFKLAPLLIMQQSCCNSTLWCHADCWLAGSVG